MRVVIRVDASGEIGAGHVMRCLALADALISRGHRPEFISRVLPGNLIDVVRRRGYSCIALEPSLLNEKDDWLACQAVLGSPPDWMVVDSYRLGADWELAARAAGVQVLAIDDGGVRPHACRLILDHNQIPGNAERYSLSAPSAQQLIGPQYALLRSEFASAATLIRPPAEDVCSLLVCFGGADPGDATSRTLSAIADLLPATVQLQVVVGGAYRHLSELQVLAKGMNAHIWCQPPNLPELYVAADLAIGGGGVSALERCVLGVPSIVMTIADNQREAALGLAEAGALLFAGGADNEGIQRMRGFLQRCLVEPQVRQSVIAAGRLLVNVAGATNVVRQLEMIH